MPDLNINANARPDGVFRIPKGAEAYFTLDNNVGCSEESWQSYLLIPQGNPQSDNFMFEDNNEVAEQAWEDKDYLEINWLL